MMAIRALLLNPCQHRTTLPTTRTHYHVRIYTGYMQSACYKLRV